MEYMYSNECHTKINEQTMKEGVRNIINSYVIKMLGTSPNTTTYNFLYTLRAKIYITI